jgi:hypothetical protein
MIPHAADRGFAAAAASGLTRLSWLLAAGCDLLLLLLGVWILCFECLSAVYY